MPKSRMSNLPDNVLPKNQFRDVASSISDWHNNGSYDPLAASEYEDARDRKRRAKQERRRMRKNKRRNKQDKRSHYNNNNGGYNNHNHGYEPRYEKKNLTLDPRTETQAEYAALLSNPDVHILFGVGPAGTGKTYMATKWAAIALQQGIIKKIVISRPAVSVGEKHGFLPGDLKEKMEPWLLPILDVLEEVFDKQRLESMFNLGIIEIAPLAYMRGRTFKNAVVLLDEAQNCTPDQIKMFLTRIGEDAKLIITGDMRQSDFRKDNGLSDFLNRFNAVEGIEVIEFGKQDIVRHPLIGEILKMYGEED